MTSSEKSEAVTDDSDARHTAETLDTSRTTSPLEEELEHCVSVKNLKMADAIQTHMLRQNGCGQGTRCLACQRGRILTRC